MKAEQRAELEKLARAAAKRAPGLWGSDIEKGTGEYGEGEDPRTGFMVPYMETEHGKRLFDAHYCDVAEIHEEYDEDGVYAWDEAAREIFNFLAAVQPATVLDLLATIARLEAEAVKDGEALEAMIADAERIGIEDGLADQADPDVVAIARTRLSSRAKDQSQ